MNDTTGATLNFLTDGALSWSELNENFDTVVLKGATELERFPICKRKSTSTPWDTFEDMLKERFPDEHPAIEQFLADMHSSKLGSLALGMYKLLPLPLLKFLMFFGLDNKLFKNHQLKRQTFETSRL